MQTRAKIAAYSVLAGVFLFVAAFQIRASSETVYLQRSLTFFVPFSVAPFTAIVDSRDFMMSWEQGHPPRPGRPHSILRPGDEILRMNGQAFRGMSVYLRELWATQHQRRPTPFDWKPFTVTVRSGDSQIRNIEIGFPHCTCGAPTLWQAITLSFGAPMFCLLLGFLAVLLRPLSTLAWVWLGLMLSLSQLQLWEEPYTGFQLTASPMAWADWFRLPAVGYRAFIQNAWPAALFIAAVTLCRRGRGVSKYALLLTALFVVFAALKAALAISLSENFRALAPVHSVIEYFQTELTVASLLSTATLACMLHRRFGLAVTAMAILAAIGLYWSAARITEGQWIAYSDKTNRFELTIPPFRNTPGLVLLLFASGCSLAGIVAARRRIPGRLIVGLVLCLPLLLHAGGALGGYWHALAGPRFDNWPWIVLSTAGPGLALITSSIIRRTVRGGTEIPAACA